MPRHATTTASPALAGRPAASGFPGFGRGVRSRVSDAYRERDVRDGLRRGAVAAAVLFVFERAAGRARDASGERLHAGALAVDAADGGDAPGDGGAYAGGARRGVRRRGAGLWRADRQDER